MKLHWGLTALAFAGALAAGLSAAAQDRAQTASKEAGDAAQVQRGKQLYAERCSHCHGFNMISAGNVTYDLRTFPHDQRDRFFESVTNGKDRLMPPWGDVLSQEQIGDIWAYIRTGGQ
jgi:cytochrome c55X